jgi:hypothetical protein
MVGVGATALSLKYSAYGSGRGPGVASPLNMSGSEPEHARPATSEAPPIIQLHFLICDANAGIVITTPIKYDESYLSLTAITVI